MQKLTAIEEQNSKIFARHDRMLAEHDQRISAIADQPARDAKRIKDSALGAVGGAIGTGVIAVSYTHLDVYKRQVFDYATAGAQGSGEYIYELIQPGVNQVSKSNNFKIDIEVLDSRSEPPAWKVDE